MTAVLAKHGLTATLSDHFTDPVITVRPKARLTPVLRKIIKERREELVDELYAAQCDTVWPNVGADLDQFLERRRDKACATHPVDVRSVLVDHPNGLTLAELSFFLDAAICDTRDVLQAAINRGVVRIIYRSLLLGQLYSAYER